ncbi:MAG: Isoprenylcysteine carboxyl methyltransferase [Verrucomicrobia bacterium]|nr:Isoprenylcysteine carboxyl methyltransferase [Verrucomicrobiota bacterium]
MMQSILLLALVVAGPVGRVEGKVWKAALEAGVVLFGVGAYLGVAGVRHLGRNRTPYPEPLPEAELVTTGVYAWVRHPLYACLIYAGFGWALLFSSSPALVMAVINVVFFAAKARCEERWLRARYPAYEAYSRRVKGFVPGIY